MDDIGYARDPSFHFVTVFWMPIFLGQTYGSLLRLGKM
jgi:hypothetical protein